MTDTEVLRIASDAIVIATKLAAPVLLVALVIGVMVSLFQAITQVQEMALSFVPKLIGAAAVILVGGHWMLGELVTWVRTLWGSIPEMF